MYDIRKISNSAPMLMNWALEQAIRAQNQDYDYSHEVDDGQKERNFDIHEVEQSRVQFSKDIEDLLLPEDSISCTLKAKNHPTLKDQRRRRKRANSTKKFNSKENLRENAENKRAHQTKNDYNKKKSLRKPLHDITNVNTTRQFERKQRKKYDISKKSKYDSRQAKSKADNGGSFSFINLSHGANIGIRGPVHSHGEDEDSDEITSGCASENTLIKFQDHLDAYKAVFNHFKHMHSAAT